MRTAIESPNTTNIAANAEAYPRPSAFLSVDTVFKLIAGLCACGLLALILAFFVELTRQSWPALKQLGWRFLVSTEWDPIAGKFGALPSIVGTLVSTSIAMILALPLAIVTALFLVELAPPRLSKAVGTAIELLAAIPSIVYGMWGLFVFAPIMADHVEPFLAKTLGRFIPLFRGEVFVGVDVLTAGVILAIMILPFICAVTRDVFAMVPAVVKESAYGMGSTTWEVTRKVTMRYGLLGIAGAAILGLGRAIGETMAVTFVIGNSQNLESVSLFNPGTSITATLANEFAEASEPLYLSALMSLGLVLFVITLLVQIAARLWLARLAKSMRASA